MAKELESMITGSWIMALVSALAKILASSHHY